MDFLKLATTLKILNPFAVSIKHSAFSNLILRLFGKVSGLCRIRFFVAKKNCVFLFKWYHSTDYFLFPKLSPKFLLILLYQLLKAENVLVRKNLMNLFINSSSSFTHLFCLKTNWFESYMLWYIVRLTQTTWFRTKAAVFKKSWDTSNNLKHTDIKIK